MLVSIAPVLGPCLTLLSVAEINTGAESNLGEEVIYFFCKLHSALSLREAKQGGYSRQ